MFQFPDMACPSKRTILYDQKGNVVIQKLPVISVVATAMVPASVRQQRLFFLEQCAISETYEKSFSPKRKEESQQQRYLSPYRWHSNPGRNPGRECPTAARLSYYCQGYRFAILYGVCHDVAGLLKQPPNYSK